MHVETERQTVLTLAVYKLSLYIFTLILHTILLPACAVCVCVYVRTVFFLFLYSVHYVLCVCHFIVTCAVDTLN